MTSEFKPEVAVVGGFPLGADGRVHTTFTHNPSSLRLSSTEPNLQNIPRGNASEAARWVKECFVAPAGSLFWERDFSAIEAVLVGYFAGDPTYIRFAKLGVHAYLASHLIGQPVDLSWTDADIKAAFKALKKQHAPTYDVAKRIVHGSNYMMTPHKMHMEYPETFPDVKAAARLQGQYHELFPSIRTWHKATCQRVDAVKVRPGKQQEGQHVDPWTLGVSTAQNPFGYLHRFYNVLDWEKIGSEWVSSYGEDAKRLISFLPQSTAAAIIKKAAKRLFYEFPWVGESMRLLIHDSILGEEQEGLIAECLSVSKDVMEAPHKELPLDPAWGMGPYLSIGSEGKVGQSWASMKES